MTARQYQPPATTERILNCRVDLLVRMSNDLGHPFHYRRLLTVVNTGSNAFTVQSVFSD
ncbi:MAG TPA: hypothetical protein VGY55_14935 [Pirellulales bacterium]|nr:hypothetical protein [Pirellulales bacterium]